MSVASKPVLSPLLAASELFASLEPASLLALEPELELRRLASGHTLFLQGDVGDSLYLLLSGRLSVSVTHPDGTVSVIDELHSGACVGEMALLTGQGRAASVTALEDCELLRLSRAGFERIARSHPALLREFTQAMRPRLLRTQLSGVLVELFGQLDRAALQQIQQRLQWQHIDAGKLLFRQGDRADGMYIVVHGRLRVAVEDPGGERRVVEELTRGAVVGEFALLTGEPRAATVYAVRDSYVARLSQAMFEQLIERYPQAMMQIARRAALRARQAARAVAPSVAAGTTFALVPASPDVPLAHVAEQLTGALQAYGETLWLNSERFDRMFGRAGAAQIGPEDADDLAVLGWLSEQERRNQQIVYQADCEWSVWTQRCVRQADRVILVAQAGADPSPELIEQALRVHTPHARVELVLLQPNGIQRPQGTARWLKRRPLYAHHHLRLGHAGDLGRLVRRLTGHALGLVFSGGGARGYAHIGVIRALNELGIEVDAIGGTSMGGLIGAAMAIDRQYEQLLELAAAFSAPQKLFDFTLPLVSFLSSQKVTALFQEIFGDIQIEDLWRPFFCISSNLSSAEPVIHQRGTLWAAIRASTAIPGIFAPLLLQNNVLVDGGVMNNFPIDVMHSRLEGGPLIGVMCSPIADLHQDYRFGPSVSGWQALLGRLVSPRQRINAPLLFDSLVRTIEVNSIHRIKSRPFRELADVLIEPQLDQFDILEFRAYAAIIELGYQAARPQLAAWQASRLHQRVVGC